MDCINHVAIVLDASSSMGGLVHPVEKVLDQQIEFLRGLSQSFDQDTRASIYTFGSRGDINCIEYDRDVLRMKSLKGKYRPYGNTALIDATLKAIDDLQKTPTLYGQHAFLIYVITDGEENNSYADGNALSAKIKSLDEKWSIAVLVPNQNGRILAQRFGFDSSNIEVWSTTEKGIEEVGLKLQASAQNYMSVRSTGQYMTQGLFTPSVDDLSTAAVQSELYEVNAEMFIVRADEHRKEIKAFYEDRTGRPYSVGRGYYQLTKVEEIQASKIIALREKSTGKIFSGPSCRRLLKMPDYTIKVSPTTHPKYDIFVQSKATNRKLMKDTYVIFI